MTGRTTRAERIAMPLARDAIRQLTESRGGCTRPVQLRRTDTATGQVDQILIPCGATLTDKCPACAERARSLRAQQCRDGWHLEDEPDPAPPAPGDGQEGWLLLRAEAQVRRDHALTTGQDTAGLDELIGELDDHITAAGIRGCLTPPPGHETHRTTQPGRRSRSTRRRQDTPDLPKRPVTARTTGRVYRSPDGKTFRPSMFLTLTCDSYGKVGPDGTPADPGRYDYQRAARDAIHFAALFDRFIQNLRRYLGYDVQYFAAIEPQKRLAPHVHLAIRGAISRADLRAVIAATYHQVWWPPTDMVRYQDDALPAWHEPTGRYLDQQTGELLPTFDQALDAIGPRDQPLHVARFGPKFDAQGVLAGTKDSARCIGYLTKYLTKQLAACHTASHRRPGRPREPAHRGAAVRALLTGLRELAPLRHPAPQPPARPATRTLQRQSPPLRAPRLRRTPRPGLPQMVRQNPRRPPRRPQNLAHGSSESSGRRRPRPLHLGTRHPRRPRPPPPRPGTPARPHRPRPMASRAHRSQTHSTRACRSSGNREGSVMASTTADRLLTVEAAADRLSTSVRFIRRLIAERRIEFVKVGRHVRISEAALAAFIDAGRVEPMSAADVRPKLRGAA